MEQFLHFWLLKRIYLYFVLKPAWFLICSFFSLPEILISPVFKCWHSSGVFRHHLVSVTQTMWSYSVSGLKKSVIQCWYLTLFLQVWISLCVQQPIENHYCIFPSNQKLKVQNELSVCLHKSTPFPVLHISEKSSISPSSSHFKLLSILLDLHLMNHTSLSATCQHVPLILPHNISQAYLFSSFPLLPPSSSSPTCYC